MREKMIEQRLVQAVKQRGGICPKFVSPGFAGMPDRLILLPGGRFAFAELKAPGEKPRQLQRARHRLLMRLGFPVFVIDALEQIETALDSLDVSESVQDAQHGVPGSLGVKVCPQKQNAAEGRTDPCMEVMPK